MSARICWSFRLSGGRRGASRLPNLDEVAVRVSDVAADLGLELDRLRQELRAASTPLRVQGVDVSHPKVEEAAHPIQVAGGLERDGRLVGGRVAAAVDDDPAV